MTLQRARELIEERSRGMGAYNRNGVRLVLAEVLKEHGQDAMDGLIREFALEERFDIEPGVPIRI